MVAFVVAVLLGCAVPCAVHARLHAGEDQMGQLVAGTAANGGKGGGKFFLWAMWVWVGLGANQAPHKKRRAAA